MQKGVIIRLNYGVLIVDELYILVTSVIITWETTYEWICPFCSLHRYV